MTVARITKMKNTIFLGLLGINHLVDKKAMSYRTDIFVGCMSVLRVRTANSTSISIEFVQIPFLSNILYQ